MSPSTGRGGVSRDNLITGMSMNAVRNKKKKKGTHTCDGNKALFVGTDQGLPCCTEDVRCQTERKGELVCYTIDRA